METVLVTGGAGFIGSNIAHELLVRGFKVKIIDNLSTGRIENIQDIKNEIEFIESDIRDLDNLHKIMKGCDYVLHQAALPSVPRSIDDPLSTHEHNVNGTFNILLAARDAGVKKVVGASSSSVYGNRKEVGKRTFPIKKEIMKPMPLSPYAASKLIGEYYYKVFSHIYQLPTVCLRYFNIFGPRQNPMSEYAAVIPKFITDIFQDVPPTVYGDGTQTRDFTYVANAVDANIRAMTTEKASAGETLNIACGHAYSLLDLIELINKKLNKSIQPQFQDEKIGDVKHSKASIAKAEKLIGYKPQVLFSDGLNKTIKWFTEK